MGRNMDIKIPAGEDSEESKKHGRESLRKYMYVLCYHKQNIATKVKVKTQKEPRNMLLEI